MAKMRDLKATVSIRVGVNDPVDVGEITIPVDLVLGNVSADTRSVLASVVVGNHPKRTDLPLAG